MNYFLYCYWTGSSKSLSQLLVFKSKEAREDYKSKNGSWNGTHEFEDYAYSVNDIFMNLLIADPLSSEDKLMEKAQRVFKLMQQQNKK